jgi:hypothetical protein
MAVFSFVVTRPSWRSCRLRRCLGWIIGDGSVATMVGSLCQDDRESNELTDKRNDRANVWQDLRSYRYLFEADSEHFSRRTVLGLTHLISSNRFARLQSEFVEVHLRMVDFLEVGVLKSLRRCRVGADCVSSTRR